MTAEQKEQYKELEATAENLREEVEQSRNQLEQLQKEKMMLNKDISGSQVFVIILIIYLFCTI